MRQNDKATQRESIKASLRQSYRAIKRKCDKATHRYSEKETDRQSDTDTKRQSLKRTKRYSDRAKRQTVVTAGTPRSVVAIAPTAAARYSFGEPAFNLFSDVSLPRSVTHSVQNKSQSLPSANNALQTKDYRKVGCTAIPHDNATSTKQFNCNTKSACRAISTLCQHLLRPLSRGLTLMFFKISLLYSRSCKTHQQNSLFNCKVSGIRPFNSTAKEQDYNTTE